MMNRAQGRGLAVMIAIITALNLVCHAQSPVRFTQNLNSGWLFQRQVHGSGSLGSFDRATESAAQVEPPFVGAEKPAYDDSGWGRIDLPHTWNAFDVTDEEPGYWRGIGWYRKHFRVDPKLAGKRIVLVFEGVNQTAQVWVNGEMLLTHRGGYTEFSVEIHPRFHADNVLTVKVDNLFDSSVAPTVKTDYNFYGGIYRSVKLVVTDPTFVSDLFWTTPTVSDASATVEFHSRVLNQTPQQRTLTLVHRVLDASGTVVGSAQDKLTLAPHAGKTLMLTSESIARPALWSPAEPNLYTIHTELKDGSRIIDSLDTPLGFRWFKFDPQRGLFLNGKRIQIQGTNWHQSYPGMGNALPKSRHIKDIEAMHDMGVNFWRTSHYPHDTATIEASDRLGLMVWEELPVNKEIGDVDAYTKNIRIMAQEMIERDRNHPSILIWGIAGEVNASPAAAEKLVKFVAGEYRALDSTRPVAMHAPRGEAIERLVDISGAGAGPETDAKHQQHPDRAYFDAEYSVALIGRGLYGGGPESEELGLQQHERYLSELRSRPWMAGGCIWNQFDYDGESYDPVIPHIVSFGMEDIWRLPKEVYYLYQSQWTQKPMVHIVGHWTWPGQEGKMREVKVYSNAEEVELYLNGKSLGPAARGTISGLEHPPFVWQIPYSPGVLRAVAKTGAKTGVTQIEEQTRTAGPAYKIVLTTDTDHLVSGDADSLAYLTAVVTDAEGQIVPGEHPAITFTSYGPGHLMAQSWLGHGTGYTWNAVDGSTRIAFRSTARSGLAVVSAYSPGLRSAHVDIEVMGPGAIDEMNYKELFEKDERN
jgi:beta-galactosidase